MLEKIKEAYHWFKEQLKTKTGKILAAGIVGSLITLFSGCVFGAVTIAGLTYIIWRKEDGTNELIGVTQ